MLFIVVVARCVVVVQSATAVAVGLVPALVNQSCPIVCGLSHWQPPLCSGERKAAVPVGSDDLDIVGITHHEFEECGVCGRGQAGAFHGLRLQGLRVGPQRPLEKPRRASVGVSVGRWSNVGN